MKVSKKILLLSFLLPITIFFISHYRNNIIVVNSVGVIFDKNHRISKMYLKIDETSLSYLKEEEEVSLYKISCTKPKKEKEYFGVANISIDKKIVDFENFAVDLVQEKNSDLCFYIETTPNIFGYYLVSRKFRLSSAAL